MLSAANAIRLAGSFSINTTSTGLSAYVYTCIFTCAVLRPPQPHAQFLARSTWVRTSNLRHQSSSVSVSEPLLQFTTCKLCGVVLGCECRSFAPITLALVIHCANVGRPTDGCVHLKRVGNPYPCRATCDTVCTVIGGLSASSMAVATVPGRVAITGKARVLCPVVIELVS